MDLSISVCIPCISGHIPLLDRCVQSIYRQISRPKEVIISISSVPNIKKTTKKVEDLIGKYRKRLNIIVLYTTDQQYAGENRNKAIEKSTGDIVSMIDADDFMYSNRLYIIKRVFALNRECVGVLHYFSENDEVRTEKWNFDADNVVSYTYINKLHFGHVSILKKLFKEFQYSDMPRMQDIKFIELLLPEHRHNLYIYTKKLTKYVSNDSSTHL